MDRTAEDIRKTKETDIKINLNIDGTGKAEIVWVEATPAQQAIMADFIMRAEAIRTGRVKPEEDNMLLPVLLSYRKLRFHTIINALRGCALPRKVPQRNRQIGVHSC